MQNRDLHLSPWGPYNKTYLGVAHVADAEKGLRFDLALFPGYYRRSVMCPRDLADCGAKMMAASTDLSHFIYRYELEWKDKVYVDADFRSEGNFLRIECRFCNETDVPESLTLNAVASLHAASAYHKEVFDHVARVPEGCHFIDAVTADRMECDCAFPVDGLMRGEARESGFVGGRMLSSRFFGAPKHMASYTVEATTTDTLGIRYRGEGTLGFVTDKGEYTFVLPAVQDIDYALFSIDRQTVSRFSIHPLSGKLDLDGFVVGDAAAEASFSPAHEHFFPEIEAVEDTVKLRFGDLVYDIRVQGAPLVIRRLVTDDVGQLLTSSIHNHVSSTLRGVGTRESADLFIRPLFLPPHEERIVTLDIRARGADSDFAADHTLAEPHGNPEGQKYALSQRIMSAVTLSNVVYPVYCRGNYIRHNTPGRNWDSLYTWDSGFIGMGLAVMSTERAADCLATYLAPPNDAHSPFILHGTPLPTQILLYGELVNRTGDMALARQFYPAVKNQYDFFSVQKHAPSAKETGIFSLWHLFYNSGGWDDYPPQKRVQLEKRNDTVRPVITTAFTVLCARILTPIAEMLGEDTRDFARDIEFFSDALNTYAWDEESGYYGYITLDGNGDAAIFQTDGVNADMGMDGAYPYVAGVSDETRSARILDNIKTGMMTPIGVSMVDTRAPYYLTDGYWNGSVWMPHQWILWKALLDHGEVELAGHIAETALALWERETAHTYNCYEHFMIQNGRGAGFHQFSALSTPVLMWFESYYTPFAVTGGFRTLIRDKAQTESTLSFRVTTDAPHATVLVCLPEGRNYAFDVSAEIKKLNGGTYAITFSAPVDTTVTAKEKSRKED